MDGLRHRSRRAPRAGRPRGSRLLRRTHPVGRHLPRRRLRRLDLAYAVPDGPARDRVLHAVAADPTPRPVPDAWVALLPAGGDLDLATFGITGARYGDAWPGAGRLPRTATASIGDLLTTDDAVYLATADGAIDSTASLGRSTARSTGPARRPARSPCPRRRRRASPARPTCPAPPGRARWPRPHPTRRARRPTSRGGDQPTVVAAHGAAVVVRRGSAAPRRRTATRGHRAEDRGFEPLRAVNPTRFPSERHRPLGESSAEESYRCGAGWTEIDRLGRCDRRSSTPGNPPCGGISPNSPRAGRQQG